jgi:hypothetical protein
MEEILYTLKVYNLFLLPDIRTMHSRLCTLNKKNFGIKNKEIRYLKFYKTMALPCLIMAVKHGLSEEQRRDDLKEQKSEG